jgi:ribosomal protein S17
MSNDVYHDVTVTDNDKNTSFVSDFMQKMMKVEVWKIYPEKYTKKIPRRKKNPEKYTKSKNSKTLLSCE